MLTPFTSRSDHHCFHTPNSQNLQCTNKEKIFISWDDKLSYSRSDRMKAFNTIVH